MKPLKRRVFLRQVLSARAAAACAGATASLMSCLGSSESESLEAGIFSVDITPPVGYRMSGYFEERLATGVLDPLFAKALVLRQGSTSAALVFCDVIGLSPEVTDRARQEVQVRTGIPTDHVLVSATHTHTGPLYFGVLRDYFHDLAVKTKGFDSCEAVDFKDRLASGIGEAVSRAEEGLAPVQLQVGKATQRGLSFNRRFLMKDGTVRFNPGIENPDIVRPVGPIDPEVSTIFLNRPGAGRPFAAVANFALHLDTTGGTRYSADYPYYFQQSLRKSYGDDFTLLFGTGTCGDVNHLDVSSKNRLKPDHIGATLAKTAIGAARSLKPVKQPSLAVRAATVEVPLQKYSPEELSWAESAISKVGTSELSFLDQVRAYKILDLHSRKKDSIGLEIQVFRLSRDLALVGYPGEVFVDLGLATKEASPFPNTLVVELCGDAPGYLPTRQAFQEGSYEIVNSRIAPGGAEKMVERGVSLLRSLG